MKICTITIVNANLARVFNFKDVTVLSSLKEYLPRNSHISNLDGGSIILSYAFLSSISI